MFDRDVAQGKNHFYGLYRFRDGPGSTKTRSVDEAVFVRHKKTRRIPAGISGEGRGGEACVRLLLT